MNEWDKWMDEINEIRRMIDMNGWDKWVWLMNE